MPAYTCGRCDQPSSHQGHLTSICHSPAWADSHPGSPLDKANWREFHFCCPAPFGCEIDAPLPTDGGES